MAEKRLIDANELEAHFHETKMIEIFPYWKELSFKTQSELVRFGKEIKKMIQNAPTVDAVEVVHARNLRADSPSLFECSECGWSDCDTYTGDTAEYNYCPNCGAKMDGDGNGC